MPKLNQRGVIAHLLLLLLLGAGLVAGVYLLQKGPLNFLPKASLSKPTGPETSFTLVGPSGCTAGILCIIYGQHAPEEEFTVKLYARSDIETANLFTAKMTFPKDLVVVKEIQIESEGSFIKNWVENFYDNNTGDISLVGGVPSPGLQTQTGGESSLMATIVFRAKAIGKGTVAFTDSSAILSNLNNINILTIKRGYDINVEVKPSPTPIPSPVSNFGKAIKFNNETSNNAYISINPNIALGSTMNPPFTLEAWVNTPKPSSGNYLRDYSVATLTKLQAPGDYGYIAKFNLETQEQDGKSRPMFSVLTGNGGNLNIHLSYTSVGANGSQTLEPDRWYHIAATIVSQGNTCVAKLYVNGILSGTAERYSEGGCTIRTPNMQDLLLAKPEAGAGGISGYFYPGLIDELRLSNTLRYTGNFTPSSTPFTPDPNTIVLYHFNYNFYDSAYSRDGQGFGNIQFVDSTIGGQSQPSPTPAPTCIPRPACMDAIPPCSVAPPLDMDWCPPASPTPAPKPSKGDGNSDGKINLVDMSVIHTDWMKNIKSLNFREGIDMNSDGVINTFDYGLHRALLLQLGVIRSQ